MLKCLSEVQIAAHCMKPHECGKLTGNSQKIMRAVLQRFIGSRFAVRRIDGSGCQDAVPNRVGGRSTRAVAASSGAVGSPNDVAGPPKDVVGKPNDEVACPNRPVAYPNRPVSSANDRGGSANRTIGLPNALVEGRNRRVGRPFLVSHGFRSPTDGLKTAN